MTWKTISIAAALEKAEADVRSAHAALRSFISAAKREHDDLLAALRRAQRLAGLASFDQETLQSFLEKPYVVRPLGEGQYELIVPRFISLRAGWPMRTDGTYLIFLVTKFTHLLNPLPEWLADELGFLKPSFRAHLDGSALIVDEGDPAAVFDKLGGVRAITRREGFRLILKPAGQFDLIRRIIREEGFLPFLAQLVPVELRREGKVNFTLRPHQLRDYERFLEVGAVSVFAYPQTGKSFLALKACADLIGPKLILTPRRSLAAQWRARLDLYLAPDTAREVEVATYQALNKVSDKEYTLVVFDEAHHIPADACPAESPTEGSGERSRRVAIGAATTIKTVARMGLSATPVREDGNEDLISALCGFPIGADWPIETAQRPSVKVWIVKDEAAKLKQMQHLCARPVDGKTIVFTFRLAPGERAARLLRAPFVYSKTKHPLEVVAANNTVVVSAIGNEGLSITGIRRVIELDFLGGRMEAGQRAGRLANIVAGQAEAGEHHVLMTAEEYRSQGKRLLIFEQWGLDVDVLVADGQRELLRVEAPRYCRPTRVTRLAPARPPTPVRAATMKTDEEATEALRLPSVAAKIAQAKTSVGERTRLYVERIFDLCIRASLSPEEIGEGLGLHDAATLSRYRSAGKALVKVGLFTEDGADHGGNPRFKCNQDEIERLRALASRMR